MDRIEHNSNQSPVHQKTSPNPKAEKPANTDVSPDHDSAPVSAYSDIFDDKELERLQNNLQSVSDLASKALKRFKK